MEIDLIDTYSGRYDLSIDSKGLSQVVGDNAR